MLAGLAAGPLLSQIFQPAAFGQYSMLLAVVGIMAVVVTLRLDQLMPSSADAASSFWLMSLTSVLGATAVGLALGLTWLPWSQALFVGLAVVATALFNGFYYLRLIEDRALRATAGRSVQAVGVLGGQASFGLVGLGMNGLLWGELFGRAAALLTVFRFVERRSGAQLKICWEEQWGKARWLLPSALLGALSLQLLPLGLVPAVGAASAGVFMLVYRMVVIPNSLLSKVVSDSLLVELGRLRQQGEPCGTLMEQGCGRLLIAATGIYGVLAIHGGWLFPLILDGAWTQAGELVLWLSVLVAGWSVASPMAAVFVALGKTQWSLGLSTLDLMNRAVALAVGLFSADIVLASQVLAAGGVMVYGASVLISLMLSGARAKTVLVKIGPLLAVLLVLLLLSQYLLTIGAFWWAVICGALVSGLALRKVIYG